MNGTPGPRMAGAQLLVLQYEIQVIRRQAFTHRIGTVADNDVDALSGQLPGAVDNMASME